MWVFDENTKPRQTPKLEADIPVNPVEYNLDAIINEVKSWGENHTNNKARR